MSVTGSAAPDQLRAELLAGIDAWLAGGDQDPAAQPRTVTA